MKTNFVVVIVIICAFLSFSAGVFFTQHGSFPLNGAGKDKFASKVTPTPTKVLVEVPPLIPPTITETPRPTQTEAVALDVLQTPEVRYVYKEKKIYTTLLVTPTPVPTPIKHDVYWIFERDTEHSTSAICRYPVLEADEGELKMKLVSYNYPDYQYPDYSFPNSFTATRFLDALQTEVQMQCYNVDVINYLNGSVSLKRDPNTNHDVFSEGIELGDRDTLDDSWTNWISWWSFPD